MGIGILYVTGEQLPYFPRHLPLPLTEMKLSLYWYLFVLLSCPHLNFDYYSALVWQSAYSDNELPFLSPLYCQYGYPL